MSFLRLAAPLALLVLPGTALGHDFWLAPTTYTMDAPGEVKVDFSVGDGAKPEPWRLYWHNVVALRWHDAQTVTDQQMTITPRTEDAPGFATVPLTSPGTHIIAFESNPSLSDLAADRFNAYLEHEGLSAVIAERQRTGQTSANGTETYARRAKAVVQVGDLLTDQVLRPIGHTLEIVPEKHPHALGTAGVLPVQVLYRGRPLPGAQVSLIDLNGDGVYLAEKVTDAQGRTSFAVPQESAWRLNVVWSVPSPGNPRADFDTIFTSLTFGYK